LNGSAIRAIALFFDIKKTQAGRVASAGADYRYGYNGMEEEDRGDAVSSEIASTGAKAKPGEANLLNTEFRLYDPRLGQWLTPDPVFQPWESPYSAMAGNPILFSDPQGLNEEEGAKPGNTNTGKGTEENPGTVPEVVVRPPPIGLTNSTAGDIVGARSEQGYDGWNYLNWMGNDVRYAGRSGIYTFQYYDRQYDSYREFTPYTDNEYSQLRLKIANQIADNGPYVLLGGFAAPFVGVVAVKGVGLALTPIVARGVPYIPYVYNIASKPETKEFVVDLMLGDGPGVSNPFTPAGAGKDLVTNPVPTRLARVIPASVSSKTLGAPGAADVFVTAADDIAGLNANQIAERLTIPNSSSGFTIIEFNTPHMGLSSPINRTNPGFVGFGRTAGGAREFTLPNQLIPDGSTIRIER